MDNDDQFKLKKSDVYSIRAVEQVRDNIRSVIRKTSNVQKYMNLEFDDGVWGLESEDVIAALTSVFSAAIGAEELVVHQSLHALIRKDTVTVQDADNAAWIMAGNAAKLQAGDPVEPFTNVVHEEWVPAHVRDYERCWRYGRRGGIYTFKIVGGSPTTHKLTEFFTDDRTSNALSYLKRVFALPAWSRCSFRDIVGMRTWLLLDPTTSQERGRPKYSHMEANGAFEKLNRKLLKLRDTPCEKNKLSPHWDCCACGYGLTSCGRATHSQDYSARECPLCHQQGLFINKDEEQCCISCQEHRRLRIGKERNKHG